MKKGYKHNYAFVMYDIADEESEAGKNRVAKVFKVCKKYLEHHQKSVFRGQISPANLLKLKKELLDVIDEELDVVSIVMLPNAAAFDEVTLGNAGNQGTTLFI